MVKSRYIKNDFAGFEMKKRNVIFFCFLLFCSLEVKAMLAPPDDPKGRFQVGRGVAFRTAVEIALGNDKHLLQKSLKQDICSEDAPCFIEAAPFDKKKLTFSKDSSKRKITYMKADSRVIRFPEIFNTMLEALKKPCKFLPNQHELASLKAKNVPGFKAKYKQSVKFLGCSAGTEHMVVLKISENISMIITTQEGAK